jgi:hypothetical protein
MKTELTERIAKWRAEGQALLTEIRAQESELAQLRAGIESTLATGTSAHATKTRAADTRTLPEIALDAIRNAGGSISQPDLATAIKAARPKIDAGRIHSTTYVLIKQGRIVAKGNNPRMFSIRKR